MEKQYDRTYAKIDLQAIRHNIRELKGSVRRGTKVMGIVKADAYGHGAVPVAKAIEEFADAYGVATIQEAIELREAGLQQMILILGYTGEAWYEEVVQHRISQTIYTYDMAKRLSDAAIRMGTTTPVHIKLDTGMGRIGFAPDEETLATIEAINELPGIELEGLFTHFARADEETIEPAKKPFARYMDFVNKLENSGIHISVKHVSNSAAIIGFPEADLDMVRAGISLYGLYPSDEVGRERVILRPAMEWKTVISYVKDIPVGTPISYGGTFISSKPMRVATVPVGYADGMKRDLSGKGRVLIHGQYASILGRVCMDQFMVDVTDIPQVSIGDEVTIFGRQGDLEIPVEEIAALSHSFNYEFVCSVSKRVPRKHVD